MRSLLSCKCYIFGWMILLLAELLAADPFDQGNLQEALERKIPFLPPKPLLRQSSSAPITSMNATLGDSPEPYLLTVGFAENSLGGQEIRHRAYNNQLCGPPIFVAPGELLRIRLVNDLPEDDPSTQHSRDEPHAFNTTNLHTHGLHVSPSGEADNVFLEIRPGEKFQFKIPIPEDHPAGTFWYHPHKHGSVGLQVSSGMAGALIVRGGLDDAPELKDFDDEILLLQQFVIRPKSGEKIGIEPEDVYGNRDDNAIEVTAINGQVTPTFSFRPGEIQRWRFIHAGISATLDMNIIDGGSNQRIDLHEIAVDGLATGTLRTKDSVKLHPGYRSDVLVQAPAEPGSYLLKTAVPDPEEAINERAVEPKYIARIVVEGEPVDHQLPDPNALEKYRAFPSVTEAFSRGREIVFRQENGRYTIDGKIFSPQRIDQVLHLDTVEEIRLISQVGNHPFHIHVNAFEVIHPTDPSQNVWRDTVMVTSKNPVTIRTRIEDFTGQFVLHCHVLNHEDRGMMQTVKITDPSAPVAKYSALEQAPTWNLPSAHGAMVSSKEYARGPSLIVLHKGVDCPHCAEQLHQFGACRDTFQTLGIRIVAIGPTAISSHSAKIYRDAYGVTFPLLTDVNRQVYVDYGCQEEGHDHGLFLIVENEIVWKSITEESRLDFPELLQELKPFLE